MTTAQRWDARSVVEWEDVLAATHVGFDIEVPAGTFAGSVVRAALGSVALVECRSTPFAGRRGSAVLGDAGSGRIGVQMVLRGSERISRRGIDDYVLTAGDLGLWDGGREVGVEALEPFVKRTLVFPRATVLGASPRLADVETIPALGRLPGARLLARYVDAIVAELPEMDDRTRAAAGDVALELLRAAVEPLLPEARAARREALRARARRYIRVHLRDPRLAPEAIARALSVSLRTLHAAFEDTDDTVASLVRRARLARCREDLADPSGGTVTEIAFRWGFSDATHFSQAFKREYGRSPRDVRARNARQPRTQPMV